jgi:CheY-like chemotaxis protein
MSQILFIDDDEYDCRFAVRALENIGFKVTFCDRADTGLKTLLGSAMWSAVIMDIQMPVPLKWQKHIPSIEVGLKVLKDARDWIMEKRIPVFVYTNRGLENVVKHLDALLLPPELLQRVEKLMLNKGPEFARRIWQLAGRAQRLPPAMRNGKKE